MIIDRKMPKLCLGGCVGLSKNSVEWRWRVGRTYHWNTCGYGRWEKCFGRATDGVWQEPYISVNSKSVVSYGQYSQCHIKTPLLFVGLQKETVPLPFDTLNAQG